MISDSGSNKHKDILKDLSLIQFPSLLTINLCSNEIESLEPLSSITMPQLREIYLSKSSDTKATITSTPSLPSPNATGPISNNMASVLNQTIIVENRIADGFLFPRLHSKEIINIALDFGNNLKIVEDVSWLAKMETESLCFLCQLFLNLDQ